MIKSLRTLACLAVMGLAATLASAQAVVFQYSQFPMCNPSTKNPEGVPVGVYLWLPAEAKQIRGLIVSGQTLIEREMSKDPIIRKACAEQSLGILHVRSGLNSVKLQELLDGFATQSGYAELSTAPLFFVGHSAGGPQARQAAAVMADRCFGLMQYRGGGPWAGPPLSQPATQPTTNPAQMYVPAYIPSLMMTGQFDEFGGTRDAAGGEPAWQNPRKDLADQRAAQPEALWSMIVEPGAGHFAWSEQNARYLALFITKAAAQIPATLPADGSAPKLTRLDYKKGWLSDLNLKPASTVPAAVYTEYTGDKTLASWHMDEALAKAAAVYHAGLSRKDQFIKWEDPYTIDAGVRFFFSKPVWVDDGMTLEVHPAWWDKVPPRWPNVGEPATNGGTPIKVKTVAGILKPISDRKFRIEYDALSPATEGGRNTFMAYSDGNEEYRHCEQVGMLPKNFGPGTKGKDNTITFPPIGNLKTTSAPVPLNATADTGLKVQYYVAEGPATVVEGKLVISEVPVRAKFPIKIRVVAWQFGSLVEPLVKGATPVVQEIQLEK
jgi:hypothetical protein